MRKLSIVVWVTLTLTFAVAAFGTSMPEHMPLPGLVNSVQGNVSLNGHSVMGGSIPNRILRPHEVLATQHGSAEVLLTPGAFLRLGSDSAARMISRSLEDSQVRLTKGKALLRVESVFKHTLSVVMNGATTRIDQKGLYGFNVRQAAIGVLQGKVTVYQGGSRVILKSGRELVLSGGQSLFAQRLSKQTFESGQLFRWSKLRDRYESQARESIQQSFAQTDRWHGPGWYRSRFWGFYTYVPSGGTYLSPYYSPYAWDNWGWNGWNQGDWGWGGWDDDDGD